MGIQIGQIRAGQLATILVTGAHDMATGGTMGRARNPLRDRVTRDHRLVLRVSGVETYNRRLARDGRTPVGAPTYWEWVKDSEGKVIDGLAVHKKNGTLYLVCDPTSVTRTVRYLVDGREATAEEQATIHAYRKDKSDDEPDVLLFKLDSSQTWSEKTDPAFERGFLCPDSVLTLPPIYENIARDFSNTAAGGVENHSALNQ